MGIIPFIGIKYTLKQESNFSGKDIKFVDLRFAVMVHGANIHVNDNIFAPKYHD